MKNQGFRFAALYERLSKDDELQGESNSISNQKGYLEDYARKHGYTTFKHYTDDGYTGKNFNRPGFQAMLSEIEDGLIDTVIVKDMSRFGRNYLQVGFYTEILFPKKQVHFIAINSNIDSDNPQDNDFAPFLNIMNEWYVKDTSKKITAIFKSKMESGQRCSGSIPYGYNRLPNDKQTLIVDPEVAPIVKKIFVLASEGLGPTQIARQLSEEKVLIPSAYTEKYHPEQSNGRTFNCDEYSWSNSTVSAILDRREYLGHTVLRKSICTNFKTDTRRKATEDELLIFPNTHEPIISQDLWDLAQKERKRVKSKPVNRTCKNFNKYRGLLFCGECGSPLRLEVHHLQNGDLRNFRCANYKGKSSTCTSHYINEKVLDKFVLQSIQRISRFVTTNQNEFAEDLQRQWIERNEVKPKQELAELKRLQTRYDELDTMFRALYENFVSGKVSNHHYDYLSKTYNDEQGALENKIDEIKKKLTEKKQKSLKIEQFIEIIQKYTEPQELSKDLLIAYIDKIVIHDDISETDHRQVTVDIFYNFIGQYTLAYSDEELEEQTKQEEEKKKELALKQKKRNKEYHEKEKAARYASHDGHKFASSTCKWCGNPFWPNSSRQIYCSDECKRASQRKTLEDKRLAEKGSHTYKQKTCTICGTPFWPVNGREVICSPECKAQNRREKQLAYYYSKIKPEKHALVEFKQYSDMEVLHDEQKQKSSA